MAIFDGFPVASFNGVKIPISRISVKGGLRKYTHEFPHSPGGEQEKLGRKLYVVRMTAHFHDLPGTEFAEKFPECYPDSLLQLRQAFEKELTADLVIPSVGTIKAFAVDWEQIADFERALSGEDVNLEFEEDQDSAALTSDPFAEFGVSNFDTKMSTLTAQAALADYFGQPQPSIFDDINSAISAVQAIQGIGDQYSTLIAAKLEGIANLCAQADAEVKAIQHPENHQLLEALKDLWQATVDLAKDVAQSGTKILVFSVPRLMSIAEVSTAIYGDASRAVELLQLNPIEDAFAIQAGTPVRYRQG